jgi:hypothetical protein
MYLFRNPSNIRSSQIVTVAEIKPRDGFLWDIWSDYQARTDYFHFV